jgi:hypothetical protein
LALLKLIPNLDVELDLRRDTTCYDILSLARHSRVAGGPVPPVPELGCPRADTLLYVLYQANTFALVVGNILPGPIATHDEASIMKLARLVGAQLIPQLMTESAADIFTFLLSYPACNDARESLRFFGEIADSTATKLMADCISPVALSLLLHLGRPDFDTCLHVKRGIGLVATASLEKRDELLDKQIRAVWLEFVLPALLSFSDIVRERRKDDGRDRKQVVVCALKASLEYLENAIASYYPKFVSLISIAIRVGYLQTYCFEFWDVFVDVIKYEVTLQNLFVHIVAQYLKYFDEYPAEITKILAKLIIQKVYCRRKVDFRLIL